MPAANTDLGYAVQNEYRQLLGLFWGSVKDTRAEISEIKCRPVGDVDIQGPPCFTNAMPKGPSQSQPFADCTNESCTATLEPLIQGERCHYRHRKTVTKLPITGVRRGSHRNSNGFVGFACTQLQEAVVILGGPSRTHNGAHFDHFSLSVSTPLFIQYSIR